MKMLPTLFTIIAMVFSQSAAAESTISIINNTAGKMDIQYNYCNSHKLCNFIIAQQLQKKGTDNSYTSLLLPVDMENVHITSAMQYDDKNNLVATLDKDCISASTGSGSIVLDSFGTDKVHCLYVGAKA